LKLVGSPRRFAILTSLILGAALAVGSTAIAQTRAATSAQALDQALNESCSVTTTKTPPFYDVAAQNEDVDYSQARTDRPEFAGYIPKNSIVKLTQSREISLDRLRGTDYVNIQVLSSPNAATDQNARVSPVQIKQPVVGKGSRLGVGFRGQIQFSNLRPAGDLTYIVDKDAPALQIPGGQLTLAGRPIRLATAMTVLGSAYKVNRCCPPQKGTGIVGYLKDKFNDAAERAKDRLYLPSQCHDNYIFEVLNPTTFCPQAQVEIAAPNCDAFTNALRPVSTDQLHAVQRISQMTGRGPENLELIDSSGLVKIPVDPETGLGPFGSLHAYRNPRPEPGNSLAVSYDAFLQATSACAFMRVLEANAAICKGPGCQVQWNDAYHPFLINGKMSHVSHTKDSCIDVFPLSKTTRGPGSVTWQNSNYDRAKTFALLDLMVKAGADISQFGFNDPEAMKRFGTKRWPGHDNHIHVCFPNAPNPNARVPITAAQAQKVENTCKNGLLPSSPSIRAPASGLPPPILLQPRASATATRTITPDELPTNPTSSGLFGFMRPRCQ
jgi:hypothetical protein